MPKNNENGDHDSVAGCEDDEMMCYRKYALSVVTFRIVREENDLETRSVKTGSFHPDMAHQVFGETERIFGYKHLSINLYYLHNSAKCYLEVSATDKIMETEGVKADDILNLLNPWLPSNYTQNKEEFKEEIAEEDHSVMYGEVINTFQDSKGKNYNVTLCDIQNENFKEFHQRFETFIVWFIDAANFIDLDDERWMIFYVYEEYQDSENRTCRSPVGFCTVYKFFLYPDSTRPRISQFFVLPTHQKRGIGTHLYMSVYDYLLEQPESGDITVEEPAANFQRIRDFCDSLQMYRALKEEQINISTQNQKQISEFLRSRKICKRQAQRVFDILECLKAHENGYEEYKKFVKTIRERIDNELKKETRGSKRLCNVERAGVVAEPLDKKSMVDSEYNKYVNSLEWPTNRLRAHLSQNPI